jgi:hypothetical protein
MLKVVYTRKTDVFYRIATKSGLLRIKQKRIYLFVFTVIQLVIRDKKLKKDICKDYVHGAETYVMGMKNEQGKVRCCKA